MRVRKLGEIMLGGFVLLFFILWIIKPQHIDKVITKTVYVPAQFQYKVGESVYANDQGAAFWTPATVVGINNSDGDICYLTSDMYGVNCNPAGRLATEKP